jgi:predicted 2-oxoglutarate/Fe(II)-dependent dioxygenase YbiX
MAHRKSSNLLEIVCVDDCGFDWDSVAAMEDLETLTPAFSGLASRMPPTVRALIVDGAAPSSVRIDDLLLELHVDTRRALSAEQRAHVLRTPILDAAACRTLREAVDEERTARVDSVDGGPDHQLPLSREKLESLIGRAATISLLELPSIFRRESHGSSTAGAVEGSEPLVVSTETPTDIFARRYTGSTRPWNPFHQDSAAVTVNVALSSDAQHSGGKLIAVEGEDIVAIERAEGEATVHDSRLLHAVTRITEGVRYSLIMFFGRAQEESDAAVAAAFDAFLSGLPAAARTAVLAAVDDETAPIAHELGKEQRALEWAKGQAPGAKAEIEHARAELDRLQVGTGGEQHAKVDEAEAQKLAHERYDAAVRAAKSKRELAFNNQVRVERPRLHLGSKRNEVRERIMSEHTTCSHDTNG